MRKVLVDRAGQYIAQGDPTLPGTGIELAVACIAAASSVQSTLISSSSAKWSWGSGCDRQVWCWGSRGVILIRRLAGCGVGTPQPVIWPGAPENMSFRSNIEEALPEGPPAHTTSRGTSLDRLVGRGEEDGPLFAAPSRSAGNRKSPPGCVAQPVWVGCGQRPPRASQSDQKGSVHASSAKCLQ